MGHIGAKKPLMALKGTRYLAGKAVMHLISTVEPAGRGNGEMAERLA